MNEPFQLFVRKSKYEESRNAAQTTRNRFEDYLELTNIDGLMVQYTGLQPMNAVIYTTALAGLNGATFQSSRLNTRNIVLTFTLLSHIEENRRLIFSMFTSGSMLRLFYAGGGREAWIDGVVETLTTNQFLATPHKQVIQVSMLCPDPLLKSMDEMEIVLSGLNNNVYYGGEYPYGIKAVFTFTGQVANPVIIIRPPYQVVEDLKIVGQFTAADTVILNTIQGQRSVIQVNGNTETDITNNLEYPIHWSKVTQGYNYITYGATTGASLVRCTLYLTEVYGGV